MTHRFKCKSKFCHEIIQYVYEDNIVVIGTSIFGKIDKTEPHRYDVYIKCNSEHKHKYLIPDDDMEQQ